MSNNISLQESPDVKAQLLTYFQGDEPLSAPRKIDLLYTDSSAAGVLTEMILDSVQTRKSLSSRDNSLSFLLPAAVAAAAAAAAAASAPGFAGASGSDQSGLLFSAEDRLAHVETQMSKPCLASEMLVTRLAFKQIGGSISCSIDGQNMDQFSGPMGFARFIAAIARSSRTAGDSMLIISGLEHCISNLEYGYATLKLSTSSDRGFQRVFAEVAPESAQKIGVGALTRSNPYNLSSVDIGADPELAADIRMSLARRRASAALPPKASLPTGI